MIWKLLSLFNLFGGVRRSRRFSYDNRYWYDDPRPHGRNDYFDYRDDRERFGGPEPPYHAGRGPRRWQ